MLVGIDMYSYHRYFGEVYPQQGPPPQKMTPEDFLTRAKELEVDGVTLENCFMPSLDLGYLGQIRGIVDDYGFDRVWGWGHPNGLEGGTNTEAYKDMIVNFQYAHTVGAKIMRVVGSSLAFRNEPHAPQLQRLERMFKEAVKVAEDNDIKMAVENHFDFYSYEFQGLLETIASPYFGLNFDTGNFLRMMDDPVKAMDKLSPYVLATHVKDLKVQRGVSTDEWFFFSCTPVGEGVVDNATLAQQLKNAGYTGTLAFEVDFLHPDYENEDVVVAQSVAELKRITRSLV